MADENQSFHDLSVKPQVTYFLKLFYSPDPQLHMLMILQHFSEASRSTTHKSLPV